MLKKVNNNNSTNKDLRIIGGFWNKLFKKNFKLNYKTISWLDYKLIIWLKKFCSTKRIIKDNSDNTDFLYYLSEPQQMIVML